MSQKLENAKINAAVDMLIESDSDLSNILGKETRVSHYKTACTVGKN